MIGEINEADAEKTHLEFDAICDQIEKLVLKKSTTGLTVTESDELEKLTLVYKDFWNKDEFYSPAYLENEIGDVVIRNPFKLS